MELSFYEALSLLIALLAVVVAFISLNRSGKISAKQLELQEAQTEFTKFQHEILAKEQSKKEKADIRITPVKDGINHRLLISNVGDAIAHDIVFEAIFDDGEDSFLIESEMDSLLPITHLLPNQEVPMLIAPHMGSARSCLAKITWLNEEREIEKQNIQIKLF